MTRPRHGASNERARASQDTPRVPFYKDERVLHGTVQVAVSVRVLLIALITFVGLATWGLLYLNAQANRISDLQHKGRADRLQALAEVNGKVQELACFLVSFIDQTDPEGARVASVITDKYHCPPPSPTPKPTPSRSPAATPHPSASSGSTAHAHAPSIPRIPGASSASGTTRSRLVSTRSGPPRPTPSTPRSTPRPTPSTTATPTPAPTRPVLDLGGTLCQLLGVCLG